MKALFEGLSEILEVDQELITLDYELGNMWDSLAIVSTIALVDETHSVFLDGDNLEKCKTVKDILVLAEKK